MAKAILSVGYNEYVFELEEAITIVNILAKAERFESKYHTTTSGRTQHIYENEEHEFGQLKLITDGFYRMAKLAGKPDKS
jgi:hypothetical protein